MDASGESTATPDVMSAGNLVAFNTDDSVVQFNCDGSVEWSSYGILAEYPDVNATFYAVQVGVSWSFIRMAARMRHIFARNRPSFCP